MTVTSSSALDMAELRDPDSKAARPLQQQEEQKTCTLSARTSLLPLATLLLWGSSSSLLIIINKHIMVDLGFAFPLMLTGLNQMTAAIAALLVSWLGFVPIGRTPAPGFALTRLLPVGMCAAGTLFFGNVAYLSLSVSFIQILKVMTPAVTLAICMMLRLERLTPSMAGSIALITAGTAVATVSESSAGFAWAGFVHFVLSMLLEAVRVISIQLLLGRAQYNEAEVLVYLGLPAAVVLLVASLAFEREGVLRAWPRMAALPQGYSLLAGSMLLGTVVNLATALAIRTSSSLTFKVFGCVKNSFVVLYGVIAMGDIVSPLQLLGYMLSVAGFAWYSAYKRTQSRVVAKKHA